MIWCALEVLFALFVAAIIIIKILSKLTMGWCQSNTCLIGKTVLITGGNSGLGYETALALAGRGARVIIADVADTSQSVQNVIRETNNSNVLGKFLDLSSLDSVRKFCIEIIQEERRLDILINNAGVGGLPLKYTSDGLQIHMQVNYFGHFLLTHLLIDLLKKTKSRVIFLSSIMAFYNDLTLENLNNPKIYSDESITYGKLYGNTKLCDLIASNVFAEKLRDTSITSNAVYPGLVNTGFVNKTLDPSALKLSKSIMNLIFIAFGKTPYEGAQTQIHCALSKELENVSGGFFADCKKFRQPKLAKEMDFCRSIWKKSEELVKLKPEEMLENVL